MNKTVSVSKDKNMLSKSPKTSSIIDWITEHDSLVVFGGFGAAIVITIILTGIFQAGDIKRENVLYNTVGALAMAGAFIYVIFSFMGSTIIILGQVIDIGMIIYIAIILFVIFVLGN